MFEWYGAAGQLYSCGCASSTRSKIMMTVLYHTTLVSTKGVNNTNIIKAEDSRRLYVVLYWRVCSIYTPSNVNFR